MDGKEICWNITARCNQACKYCHRFLKVRELSYDENLKILNKLIQEEVTDITWTGGEALLVPYLDELLKISWQHCIRNKLITNGKLLTNERIDAIAKYIDSITLSINEAIGRGFNHYDTIKGILDYIQNNYSNIKIRINSVISSYTKDVDGLVKFLNNYNIYSWRIFKFMPLRELAVTNRERFYISMEEYQQVLDIIKQKSKIGMIDSRTEIDMEKKYILILADGSIMVTEIL